ncbi:hypothetical protein [Clostridium sp. C8-1-8]|nr:hypothetical protein [Clostridium sp. C8-1-8]
MFTLKKLNVVRIVETERERDELLKEGFDLSEQIKETKGKAK